MTLAQFSQALDLPHVIVISAELVKLESLPPLDSLEVGKPVYVVMAAGQCRKR